MIFNRILLSCLLLFTCALAQAGDIQYLIGYATFNAPEEGPYIEVYFSLNGSSVTFQQKENNTYQADIEFTLLFKQDSNIVKFDKYVLSSPEVKDSNQMDISILDLKRYTLPNGNYTVEVQMKDRHNPEVTNSLEFPFKVAYEQDKVQISDVQLLEGYTASNETTMYTKHGYELLPYPINFYPTNVRKIRFYAEIYNTEKVIGDKPFLAKLSIKTHNSDKVAKELTRFSKKQGAPVNVVLSEFDISELPSGNYNLEIDIRNDKNEQLAKKSFFFQRSNKNIEPKETDITAIDIEHSFVMAIPDDSISFYIESLKPISGPVEQRYERNLVKGKDIKHMRQFMFNFWQNRNISDPAYEWLVYKAQVDMVERSYATQIDHGFETDRGRVYLQYGSPNHMQQYPGPGARPYEVWQYYSIDHEQSNVKFVFYMPYLGSSDYILAHSTANGERYDPNWETKLFDPSFNDGTNNLPGSGNKSNMNLNKTDIFDPTGQ